MNSPISESMAESRRSESFSSSNPESPASPLKNGTETMIPGQDIDFNSKAYANELLEHGLKEERFRIDRKKLEDMLQTQQNSSDAVENAEVFFQRVMMETSTLVTWPSKLKIGAKSKKDPHVKIVGKPEAVQEAKEMILEILDTKKNRVTLKMDVSHTDHSYIIGKGGFKIQQVMEETGCHIHFPDSNKPKHRGVMPFKTFTDLSRNNSAEKSNQVSIAGQAAGVELARAKIRDLLPFVFMFDLPNGDIVPPSEQCSPAIKHIQQTYSFNVAFRSLGPPGIGRTVLIVRGCQRLLPRLRQGISLLMEYLIGSKTVPVMGFMKTEIAAQNHQFVKGACNGNIQMIMNMTGATIIFPDSSSFGSESPSHAIPYIDGHNAAGSKSTVIIQGSFDSVCMAWQELLKCLPLVLMFDLKEGQELDPVMVNNFMETYNINIMVRPKIKENTKSVLISGAEKDCKVLFKVRKEILGLEEDDSASLSPSRHGHVPTNGRMPEGKNQIVSAQNMSTAESLSLLSNIIQQNPQIVGLLSNLSSAFPAVNAPEALPHPTLPDPLPRAGFKSKFNKVITNEYESERDVENWINRHEREYAMSNATNLKNFRTDDGDSADSGVYIHPRNRFQHVLETRSDVSSQPESPRSSTSSNDTPDMKTNSFFRRISQTNESNVGVDIHHLLAEYGNKKLSANKAMQQPIGDGIRTPTQLWSGYGFSKSMPDFVARMKQAGQNSGSISEYLEMDDSKLNASSKAWPSDLIEKNDSPPEPNSPFSFSNFWENIPQQPTIDYGAIRNVEQLLHLLDLQKYSEVLAHHEIDMITLLTLSDLDLQQLGMSYGARRKMLAAIAAIRDHRLGDWSLKNFRAAPGAERRTFHPRYPSGSPHPGENAQGYK